MKRASLLLVCGLIGGTPDGAQAPGAVRWEASARPGTGPDARIVTLRGVVDDGWHVYAETQGAGGPTPLVVRLEGNSPYKLAGPFTGTRPIRHRDTSFGFDTEYYTGTFVLQAPVKTASHGTVDVPLAVRFQMCSETTCLPPRTVHLVAKSAGA